MKNYWIDKKPKYNFNQKFLDEAMQLERMWMKMGLLDLTGRLMGMNIMESQRLTNENYDDSDFRGAD